MNFTKEQWNNFKIINKSDLQERKLKLFYFHNEEECYCNELLLTDFGLYTFQTKNKKSFELSKELFEFSKKIDINASIFSYYKKHYFVTSLNVETKEFKIFIFDSYNQKIIAEETILIPINEEITKNKARKLCRFISKEIRINFGKTDFIYEIKKIALSFHLTGVLGE
ncbi:MAG: hypothetical protein ACRCW9_06560 [Cetobacterium sp.]